MGTGTGAHATRIIVAAARTWWDAFSSGRFFTWWSALVSFVLLVTVLPPYGEADAWHEYLIAQLVSLAGAVVLLVIVLPAAWGERRLSSRPARAALIVVAVVAVAMLRPHLNDAINAAWFGNPTAGEWGPRVFTNLVAWVALLSLVALTTTRYASSHDASQRLVGALHALAESRRRAIRFQHDSGELVARVATDLRVALADLLAAPLDFDRVRDFSSEVRRASHDLLEQSRRDLDEIAPVSDTTVLPPRPHTPLLSRLRPPPLFVIGGIFVLGNAPFLYVSGGWGLVVLGVVVEGLLALGADLVSRRLLHRRSARARGAVFLGCWLAVGIVIATVGSLIVEDDLMITLTPIVTVPGLAAICALCTHAIHRATRQERRLSSVLGEQAAATAARTAQIREPLAQAADVLHGRVQGKCVILAATVDDAEAAPEEIAAFEREVRAALDDVAASLSSQADSPEVAVDDLFAIIAVWRRVLTIDSEIGPRAADALRDPVLSQRVAGIVNEAFVNAVKHATARTATLEITALVTAPDLRVRVSSPGELRPTDLSGHGLAALGPRTRLFERDGNVVLEAVTPIAASELTPAR